MTDKHVSTFALDVYFASDARARRDDAELSAHVASCARCAAYLDALAALDRNEVTQTPYPIAMRRTGLRRLLAPSVTALAMAAGLALYLTSRSAADDPTYVGTKGTPAVQVFVRGHDAKIHIWDGRASVAAGDALALHVACEQLAYVTVTTEQSSGLARVWEGTCPKSPSTLPFTLVVDDHPGHERFTVVLGRTRRATKSSARRCVPKSRAASCGSLQSS